MDLLFYWVFFATARELVPSLGFAPQAETERLVRVLRALRAHRNDFVTTYARTEPLQLPGMFSLEILMLSNALRDGVGRCNDLRSERV